MVRNVMSTSQELVLKLINKFGIKKIWSVLGVSFLGMIGIIHFIYVFLWKSPAQENYSLKSPRVATYRVYSRTLQDKLILVGKVQSFMDVEIFPDIVANGLIDKLHVRSGDQVQKGDVLMDINQQAVTGHFYNVFEVKSPLSGVVSDVIVEEGYRVSQGTLLCRVSRLNPLKVFVDVPAKDAQEKIRQGGEVALYRREKRSKKLVTVIRAVHPVLNSKTLTQRLEIWISEETALFKAGDLVWADVFLDKENMILIPFSSVLFDLNRSYIYVYDSSVSKVFKRYVALGKMYGDEVRVLKGLIPKEEIVVSGQSWIFDHEDVIRIPENKERKKVAEIMEE